MRKYEYFVFTQNARNHCRGNGWNECLGHFIGVRNIPSLHLGP